MFLLLIRHGDATMSSPDSERPLSESGKKEVQALSEFLTKKFTNIEFQNFKLIHSPLKRAIETKDIVVKNFNITDIKENTNLTPMSDTKKWENDLIMAKSNTVLVGHQPFMANLAQLLTSKSYSLPTGNAILLSKDDNSLWSCLHETWKEI
ncbi:phosphohistidine phosphatase SixA [Bacteriovoracaceae bacterium]|nr:phosphohistidine phosphatase SixA [Bacteriovoracaceae bacterium]